MNCRFSPEEGKVQGVLTILNNFRSTDNATQRLALEQLDTLNNQLPDFYAYLAFIFSEMKLGDQYLRHLAGLTLKKNLVSNWTTTHMQFVKACALKSIQDPIEDIRNTAGTLVTTIISIDPDNWPEAIDSLVTLLDHENPEGAFSALNKICEDSTRLVESLPTLPAIIRKFISHFTSPSPKIRRLAINCCNQFILLRSQAFNSLFPEFIRGIFALTSDTDTEVRIVVCQALVMCVEANIDVLMESLQGIVEFMLHCSQDKDELVAREACEFWLVFTEMSVERFDLVPLLPRLLPILLRNMVYSEMDIIQLSGLEEDDTTPDRDQDIKPRHHKAKLHGSQSTIEPVKSGSNIAEDGSDDDSDYDEDDDGEASEWNLRKCSAAALDVISTTCENALLPHLLPLLNEQLNSADWIRREAGILALGAIAEGCYDGMVPHLPGIIPVLVHTLNDPKALVRSITCWTLGRYCRWVIYPPPAQKVEGFQVMYLQPVLDGILRRVLDNNKRVQEAGCSALATFEEEAREELIPYLDHVLTTLSLAFSKYQHKNLLILYDAVGTLADSVGTALNEPKYVEIIIPPLIMKYNQLADDDTDIFPLLECLSSVATSMGTGFEPVVTPIWNRCLRLIASNLQQWQLFVQQAPGVVEPDKDFIVVALDLMSGVCQGMGSRIEGYLVSSQPPLIPLLFECMKDPNAETRQSAFALLGDLAIFAFAHIKPHLAIILPEAIKQIDPNCPSSSSSVCNNAVWSSGEIALQHKEDIAPFVPALLERLIPLLINPKIQVPALLENAAITIGRLGGVCPTLVAPHLEVFIQSWCSSLGPIRDNNEKESAFIGLCKMIEINPSGVQNHLVFFMDAVLRWGKPSPELNCYFERILRGYRQMLGDRWDGFVATTFPDAFKAKLKERYNL